MRANLVAAVVLVLASLVVQAQDLAVARAAAKIDTAIPWITDGFHATDPGMPVPRLPRTGVDRNKLLDEALARAANEKRLVLWYIPRIEGGHMVRPEILDAYMRIAVFTNPMVSALVNERFVPLRMAIDGPIGQRTGIKRVDWVEPAIAILGPNGAILHRMDRIRTFDPRYFFSSLMAALDAHRDLAPLPEGLEAGVERAIQDAATDYPEAEKMIGAALSLGYETGAARIADALIACGSAIPSRSRSWSHVVLAQMTRSRGDPTTATVHLDAATPGTSDEATLTGWIQTLRGDIALDLGRFGEAEANLTAAADDAKNFLRAHARYALGIAQALQGETTGAESTFRRVVADFVDDPDQWPFAAMAAGNLLRSRDTTPLGPAFHGFEDPVWAVQAALAESRPSTCIPRPVGEMPDAVTRGVAYLLRHQGEEGGFEDSRYAYCDSPRILPNVWVAITAIALAALSDWREVDPPATAAAIARGERYLFSPGRLARGTNEECYADAFRLIYLRRRLAQMPQDSPDAPILRKRVKAIADALCDQQRESGYWAHEYQNPFCTAAALLALDHAREGGAAVPAIVFDRGVNAIAATRGPQGTFTYGAGRGSSRESDDAFKNAMARMPICERALLFCAATPDTTALEAALDNFEKWLPRYERIRVCDFHTDGELGGFFFWHGMFLTSEAIKALPAEKRAAREKRLTGHVMSIGEMDGTWIDSHEMGKSYGTGMALMILRNGAAKKP